ncbi:ABC transporter ATP-binding protein [Paenibacillus sp. J5C_2022]|uniref:ABC transporter ATP-binding protein n=1 Tax=Paenibacillus sp. J5C2022 TaxID=2977129 RepID=UPI0021CFF7D0|nr:ABC transporter ATP-binding protein [Paenibacillus sp. J5C2022]MCU6711594.1 ABC transporter ATP-binding protein [Paenibacillus sp. J5C2022]
MGEVKFDHVYKYYKGEAAPSVDNFHLDVADGEFLVMVGPSGCGKSTTLRMLAGLEEVSKGDIYIDGKFSNYISPKNRDIAMVFQNYALYPNLSVYDNMALGLQLHKVPKSEIELRVNRAARMLEISHHLTKKPGQLSGGQKQRVALGRALVREPQAFLMDEPLSNLDAKLRTQTRMEISKLHSELRTTVLYVTHDQTEAMTMGTRIVVMKDGRIQQVATPQDLYDYPSNMFVAGFIGTPQMNFIPGSIFSDNDHFYFECRRFRMMLPEQYAPWLRESSSNLRSVVMGVRPEHVYCESWALEQYNYWRVSGQVDMREPMGSNTFLYTTVGRDSLICRTEAHTAVGAADAVELALRMDKAHFFDKESGASLIGRERDRR